MSGYDHNRGFLNCSQVRCKFLFHGSEVLCMIERGSGIFFLCLALIWQSSELRSITEQMLPAWCHMFLRWILTFGNIVTCFMQLNSLLVSLAMAVKWSWIMSCQPLVSFYWFRWEKNSSRFYWAESQMVDSLCLFVKVLPRASLEVARKSGPLWFWGSESQDCKLRHCWYVCHQRACISESRWQKDEIHNRTCLHTIVVQKCPHTVPVWKNFHSCIHDSVGLGNQVRAVLSFTLW
jgi:hypothetical protein